VRAARTWALIVIVVLVVLATTKTWNPWPQVWAWITKAGPVAEGASAWQADIGGTPRSVTISGGAVVVEFRTSVQVYGLAAGAKLWEADANWAGVAGGDSDAVVVTGRLLTKGYQVLDPATGAVRRSNDTATAVWVYADAIVDLHCTKAGECELTAWEPRGSKPMWTVGSTGIGFVLEALGPDLPDTQPLRAERVDGAAAGAVPMPSLLGIPGDGKVQVVDTARGRVVQTAEPTPAQRVAVVGSRVLTVTGTARDGTCYFGVIAHDPLSGQPVWSRDGLNLRTADDGSGCKQERDPAGGSDVVLGVDPYGKQELIAAHDGRDLWHGDGGQTVLAVDNSYALIRSEDGHTLGARSFGRARKVWDRKIPDGASAALTPYAAMVMEPKPAKIIALSPRTGEVLIDVKSDADVFAAGRDGLVAVSGRDMAYLKYARSSAR
jgi:outer membrane protein assembly factor BamB